jgi:thiamine pyrophosphate-dependent acetolactate synthase large subunit-like protein
MFLGNPEYECALQPIDFATVAQGFGITGIFAMTERELAEGLDALFASPGPALLEVAVDPNEPLLPPKRMPKYAENLETALDRGTPGADEIRAALKREPASTQLS